ncbi:MAG: DUF2314 domain-containing protein [Pseudomonadota bacterium]
MVRLRCPECGYLQTLSEERFLSISDDFLTCPHCHAHVPKHWEPESEEAVPDEVRHKMHAFSRRILNGGNATREVVHALESLVRRHGPVEESDKALGIGYAYIGETKKAEAFLIQALTKNPLDAEALHSLMEILMSRKKHKEAVEVGRAIIDILGGRTPDEDVAFLAVALSELGKKDEASAVLDSFPGLDPRNQAVKQAKKELGRGTGFGLGGLFRETGRLHKLFRGKGKDVPGRSSRTAEDNVTAPRPDPRPDASPSPVRGAAGPSGRAEPAPRPSDKFRATLEYWIYAPESTPPEWEDVREALAERHPRKAERERIIKLLESLMERNDLTVDYILKKEAGDLFDYPEDLIPQNSRDLADDDRAVVLNAKVIVRIRLSLANYPGVEGLVFMVRFVEAIRGFTGGVVQDAISHTLWGTEQWKACVEDPKKNLLESHVQFDALDEGGTVWIHSHGMQKFGLPDVEIEGIPSETAAAGRHLVILVGETLVGARDAGLDFTSSPLSIPSRPIVFKVTFLPRDEEGHFPAGSLKIHPYVSGGDPESPDAIAAVLASLHAPAAHGNDGQGRKSEPPEVNRAAGDGSGPAKQLEALRQRLLNAHKEARGDLPEFKKSFQQTHRNGAHVHAVKVGFPAQDGEFEWMWVSLDAWRGKSLVGHVENTPVLRKDLHKGSRVQINEGQIFDWVIVRGGEIVKGPFTENIVNSC